ncbi:MAG: hypothetical protein IKU41_02975 [Clostridia bacterium]|nr:hypothetical protein [Clostridia bacterium]
MNDIVNLIVNNGVAVVVVAYFLFMNYKYFDKLTATLTEITLTLKDIQEDIKRGFDDEKKRNRENSKDD